MVKFFGMVISLFLILIIFLRIPQENIGLTSFTTKNNLLSSASSVQRFLNFLTVLCVILFFSLAIFLNLATI